ncbi:unnamed protein product [Psylliodes chrysocephalus]|uniref:Sorting nexin-29 n=1 Tax=Psylliodes chrysocephalus TaxID=3402493 RepID=A0A9P0CZT2_9CUCU|nr:unnamed protein product [Psylliodes chrysocephala]
MLKLMSVVPTKPLPTKQSEEADKLLKQLLECVQNCQKRFGGKTELATEYDSCIAGLCYTLEAVLLFGLKTKICASHNSSAIKQVSEILINTLNTGNEYSSFWSFIYCHLTKHERERYTILKHIWTNTGRGRAWIRSSLNERSLDRYFHTLLGNQEILAEYYEPWSILRDEEKNSMLPNMAAGLNCILFAISIDKPELNSGVSHRRDIYSSKTEPIIEAPIRDTNKGISKAKRNKKVARQFISFDDDASDTSTSVPSSLSSTDSQNRILDRYKPKQCYDPVINKETNHLYSEMESYVEKKDSDVTKPLTLETSEAKENNATVVADCLTPILQEEIGEITPVSVEIGQVFETLDISGEILETPTDISAMLGTIESKNKDELDKKQEKINFLLKENETLKEQLERYISAIQMLKDDKEVDGILEDLDIEHSPNYKMEATMFERKLVQVAEMHAELMDFNVMLQENLCKKELMLETLQNELESLRAMNPTLDLRNDGMSGNVQIWIPSAFLKGTGSTSYHIYQIFMRAGKDEWNVYRRYAQFYTFHTELKKLDPAVGAFDFPPKKSLRNKESYVVEDRRKRFQIYLRRIIAHWPELSSCNSRILLEQQLPFFKDQREDMFNKNANNSLVNSRSPTDIHSGL